VPSKQPDIGRSHSTQTNASVVKSQHNSSSP
jgi:hypothetical protein